MQSRFAIGLTAAGYAEGVERRIFTEAFQQQLWDVSLEHLWPDTSHLPDAFQPVRGLPRHYQDRIVDQLRVPAGVSAGPYERRWTITAGSDGDVSVVWAIINVAKVNIDHLFSESVAPPWRAATALVEELGGYGPARLAFAARGGEDGGPGTLPTTPSPNRAPGEPGTSDARGDLQRRARTHPRQRLARLRARVTLLNAEGPMASTFSGS